MLMPPKLRGGVLQSILTSASVALDTANTNLYNFHFANISGTRYRITHNSQICYLRSALNDAFDETLRRIIVDEMPSEDMLYTYYEAETTGTTSYLAKYTDQTTISDCESAQIVVDDVDFFVIVPKTLRNKELEIRATIDKYKLVSKQYSIMYSN